jgi:tetratricopeptide (TPR) repeat protein
MIFRLLLSGCILAITTLMSSVALAQCERPIGAVPSLQGEAQVQDRTAGIWRPAALNEQLCPGDVIHVGERSRVQVTITGQPNVRLDQNTALSLPGDDQPLIVRLLYGAAYFFSRHPRRLTVDTPFIDAAVEGTEFLVRVEAERTLIVVFAGRVRASNPQGELAIGNGEAAVAEAGRAPSPYLIVRPRDAVQWTLFYPAILPALADPSGAAAQELPEPLRGAVQLAAQGQLPAAFARFEAIPETERGSDYYLYRAAALLSVGRVEEARADLGQALLRSPGDGRADALSAVIAVAQNDRDRALAEAQRAVELSPQSAAARIALSYAEQARFRIEPARQALEQAVQDEPENALAWARLSELWLMQGRRERARRAAKRARELAPELARVQTVLGFAELAEINTGRAKKAFRQAIDIDSANPLPRFGFGLATIRAGDLEGGRKEIEIAVALDPENALLRSYLGKAYFDERTTNPLTYFQELVTNFPNQENTLAAQQFAISKQLDTNDPTPWLYNAIRLQSENRPVEALRNIEKSIELNDNRAVYRSRELLDQDQAARGTSLARIYNDLGFEQLGINEATKSLSLDPSNAAAHRFLSDVYATQPRREIARVSELLQAQLLQDININPVQPSLSETGLNIITGGGPARVGLNEFTPLFERNQAQLNVSGLVGSEWTRADEAVVSGIYDNLSLSAGQFHYQSDGFRKNFDIRHNVYDLFAQTALTPDFNVQAELLRRRSEQGDLDLMFDRRPSDPNFHRDLNYDSARLGVRWEVSAQSDLIGSLIVSDGDAKLPTGETNDNAMQAETQYLLRGRNFNAVAGFGVYEIDRREKSSSQISTHSSINQKSFYIYPNFQIPSNVYWTLGVAYDAYHDNTLNSHAKRNAGIDRSCDGDEI